MCFKQANLSRLYHYNPWTDTSHEVCSSFDLYRRDPVNFFMCRFTGMTHPVAEYLANKVFCILDDPEDDSRRTTAGEFGAWARNLPALLSSHGIHRTISNSSTQGHPISASIPISHRPCSRHPSGSASTSRTPAMQSRSLSRAPSLGPAYEQRELSDLSTVFDQEHEDLEVDDDQSNHDLDLEASRSTSTTKRRKRGARKGKGAVTTTPNDETLANLADASQSLAREISKASKKSSSTNRSISTKASGSSTRRHLEPFEPVSMFAIPSALLAAPRSGVPSPIRSAPPPSVHSAPISSAPPPPVTIGPTLPAPNKKPSKWKLTFGKNNVTAFASGRVSPVEEVSPPTSSDVAGPPSSVSKTASNVTGLIMGLSPLPHSAPPFSDDNQLTGNRGRRGMPYASSNASSKSLALSSSPSPESREHRAFPDRRYHRGVSPSSMRSARPVASSASSVVSGNWRSSMSTMSSAGTSTSAFTRYSNSSMRSVSTAATSVSSTSWRTSVKSSQSPTSNNTGYTTLPKNIKSMYYSSSG
jgi:hypothetical protein